MTDVDVTIVPPAVLSVSIGDVSSVSLLYAGKVAYTFAVGETFVYGEIGYIDVGTGLVYKAQSDGTAAEAEASVMCVEASGILSSASGLFTPCGFVPGLSGGTTGALAYLSTTAGASTTSVPSTNYSKIIGRWFSATLLYFQPDWASMKLS